jgi:hypothetical protein
MLKQNLCNLQLANDKKTGDFIKEVKKRCEPTCWHGLQNSQWSIDVVLNVFPLKYYNMLQLISRSY